MDERDTYKQAVKGMIRGRYQTLYRELGFETPDDPNAVSFYAILDLEVLGARRYGRDFVDWLLRNKNPLEILFRLAGEAGVVLLPVARVWDTPSVGPDLAGKPGGRRLCPDRAHHPRRNAGIHRRISNETNQYLVRSI